MHGKCNTNVFKQKVNLEPCSHAYLLLRQFFTLLLLQSLGVVVVDVVLGVIVIVYTAISTVVQ